jgi:hypothetical protein
MSYGDSGQLIGDDIGDDVGFRFMCTRSYGDAPEVGNKGSKTVVACQSIAVARPLLRPPGMALAGNVVGL